MIYDLTTMCLCTKLSSFGRISSSLVGAQCLKHPITFQQWRRQECRVSNLLPNAVSTLPINMHRFGFHGEQTQPTKSILGVFN